MSRASLCLDKLSRLTANPDWRSFPRRLYQATQLCGYRAGLYRIPEPAVYPRFDGDLTLHLLPGEHPTRRLWFRGYVEYDEEFFIRSFVRPGMVVIDGGANIGHITLICAKRVEPGGKVHCFEPSAATYQVLCRNIQVNGLERTIVANHLALARQSGETLQFVVPRGRSNAARLAHTAVPTPPTAPADDELEPVSTIALDDYAQRHDLGRVDFLKLDIEGAESMVIEGGRHLLKRFRPTVLCEFNGRALARMGSSAAALWEQWQSAGYEFFTYHHRCRVLQPSVCPGPHDLKTFVGTRDIGALAQHIQARVSRHP